MDSCNKPTTDEVFPGLYDALFKRAENPTLFTRHNHICITQVGHGWAEGELMVQETSLNPMRVVHGGALMSLADNVCGTACATYAKRCTTLNCDMNFLRPARLGDRLVCRADTVKVGRTILVMQATITSDAGDLIATGRFTFFSTGMFTPEDLRQLPRDEA